MSRREGLKRGGTPRLEVAALPEEVLAEFPLGLTTQEVAEVMRTDIEKPIDRRAAAQMLIRAVGRGAVQVEPVGDDALWSVAR